MLDEFIGHNWFTTMSDTVFEKWLADKRVILKRLNKLLVEVDNTPVDLNRLAKGNFEKNLKKFVEDSHTPEYKQAKEQLLVTLKEVCKVYISANSHQRAAIRSMAGSLSSVIYNLVSYPSIAAKFIHSSADKEWLELGLAAALIEDGRSDFRDTYIALGELYLAAENNGIDPIPYFESLGNPPNTGTSPRSGFLGHFSTSASQELLTDFLKSEHLRSIRGNR